MSNSNKNGCGCTDTAPCSQANCACPVLISSDCVNNVTEDLVRSGVLKGQTLTEVLVQLDEYIYTKFGSVTNFFSLINVGTGVGVYKGVNTIGKKELKSLLGSGLINIVGGTNSITLSVNESALSSFILDTLGTLSDTPSFIVNSDSVEVEETGSPSKPFKQLQNALDAYVGSGVSNKDPENLGTVITIQKDVNTFTGSLAYKGLNISIENGATLVSNPSAGTKLQDLDSEATLPTNPNYSMLPFGDAESVDISITIKRGGAIQLQKEGFKNRGNTLNTGNSLGKIIRIFGDSSGIYKTAEASVVSPSTQRIFSINADNQAGFYNDGAEACIFLNNLTTHSFNSQIAYVGLGGALKHSDSNFQFGLSGTPFNIGTVPFQLNGGIIKDENSSISNPLLLTNLISLKTQGSTGSVYNGVNSKIGDSCDYIFANLDTGTTTSNQLVLDKCSNYSAQVDSFVKNFMSSNLWNIKLTNCNTITWDVDESKVALIPSSLNTLGGQVINTVYEYTSKEAAKAAGLTKGSMFINKKDITAGAFSVGEEYKILTIGTTDFTLIGATANTVGLYFTASGVGTGTGTATQEKLDII